MSGSASGFAFPTDDTLPPLASVTSSLAVAAISDDPPIPSSSDGFPYISSAPAFDYNVNVTLSPSAAVETVSVDGQGNPIDSASIARNQVTVYPDGPAASQSYLPIQQSKALGVTPIALISAACGLVLIAAVVFSIVFCRRRRRQHMRYNLHSPDETSSLQPSEKYGVGSEVTDSRAISRTTSASDAEMSGSSGANPFIRGNYAPSHAETDLLSELVIEDLASPFAGGYYPTGPVTPYTDVNPETVTMTVTRIAGPRVADTPSLISTLQAASSSERVPLTQSPTTPSPLPSLVIPNFKPRPPPPPPPVARRSSKGHRSVRSTRSGGGNESDDSESMYSQASASTSRSGSRRGPANMVVMNQGATSSSQPSPDSDSLPTPVEVQRRDTLLIAGLIQSRARSTSDQTIRPPSSPAAESYISEIERSGSISTMLSSTANGAGSGTAQETYDRRYKVMKNARDAQWAAEKRTSVVQEASESGFSTRPSSSAGAGETSTQDSTSRPGFVIPPKSPRRYSKLSN